ncbi:Ig domain-containing protein [Geomonas azotofigens]|uniref:Ig domain-containing protein n=1 Tax=Geomonas azotofigens TaxID=2843196 RepID=UPI001C0FC03A|nr:Ig domain-containing protein [Geomonas azotofigens]MBU5613504.1 Ig domain-containing protein [Geomonas azotofigens]
MLNKKRVGNVIHALFCLSLVFLAVCVLPVNTFSANYPLEISNIKPAGTGSPAIPVTNRVFRAYPGVEYNVKAAVIGGVYPFTFKLANAPQGMTIDAATGEIRWPNPQASSGTITLSVTDGENTTVSTTWTVNVSTTGFYFVDSSYSGVETGSISQPFSSIANVLANTSLNSTNILYFREGKYQFVPYKGLNASATEMFLGNSPHTWLAYPGENVTIVGNGAYLRSNFAVYLDRLNFSSFNKEAMMLWGGHHYQTIRRCNFSNLTATDSTNNNQGFIITESAVGVPGYYSVIQDNEFSFFTGASGIGSLYDDTKLLIENNYIHDAGGTGITGINAAIAAKSRLNYLFIRGNKINISKGLYMGTNMNSFFYQSNNIDISFNLLIGLSTPESGPTFNSRSDGLIHNFNFYRNTLVGNIRFENLDGNNCSASGPFKIYGNVLINDNTSWNTSTITLNYISYYKPTAINNPQYCITDTQNLKGKPSANIIDTNGDLTTAYAGYVGTYGYQVKAGVAVPPNLLLKGVTK